MGFFMNILLGSLCYNFFEASIKNRYKQKLTAYQLKATSCQIIHFSKLEITKLGY